jgi:putative SOS response-associated peptidase YedK
MISSYNSLVMCGRYTLIKLSNLLAYFPWIGSPAIMPEPRFNIAPSQSVAVVTNESAQPKIDFLRWGLVPSWAKDGSITAGSRMINARAETLAEKPAFSRLLRRQRCLIPADGFFEWQKTPGSKIKTPYYFRLTNEHPFAFAGLWDHWRSAEGQSVRTCTIITTAANSVVAPVHSRMPAMLTNSDCQTWLSPQEMPSQELLKLLAPYAAGEMTANPVSSLVSSPANEGSDLIKPAEIPSKSAPSQLELF